MNLWIRSQNREILMKVDGVYYQKDTLINSDMVERHFVLGIQAYNNETNVDMEHFIFSPTVGLLGTYKTKERALEVLDEIQKALEANDDFEYTGRACICNNNLIYEMPKE